MSKFLGPIHYWLYEKIQLQKRFVDRILTVNKEQHWHEGLEELLAESCGIVERQPLEEIIDTDNIHGWLQERITISESRLALLTTTLLKEDTGRLQPMTVLAFDLGREFGKEKQLASGSTPSEAFKLLTDSLLDGMPCDQVNQVMEETPEKITWIQRTCLHQAFWDHVDGDVANYYALRNQLIAGLLENSGLVFAETEKQHFEIRKAA